MILVSRILCIIFYAAAGLNHFINPEFYIKLIPHYLPFPEIINGVSGVLELVLAIGIIFKRSRSTAVKGLVILLVLFIPSHVFFISEGSCIKNSLCVHPIIAWLRLIVVHPLLIFWALKIK